MKKIIGIILICIIVLAAYIFYTAHKLQQPPADNPAWFLEQKDAYADKTVVVCVGDSITHGSVCFNYVDYLSKKLGPKGFVFVNAGINSHLAYNVVQRLDEIIACKPDYVTVLIGTNDVNATLMEKNTRRYIKEMNLPRKPDLAWFRDNLEQICTRLKAETNARIALLSLPPIGEELDHEANKLTALYSTTIKEIAKEQGLGYLPLNETMNAYLKQHNNAPIVTYEDDPQSVMYKALIKRYLLGISLDKTSKSNGFLLLIDLLHPNTLGSTMIAEQIEGYILSN